MRSLVAALLLAPALAAAGPFSFALIGDAPYNPPQERQVAALIEALGREPVDFVIHAGDIKAGITPCDDALFAARRQLLDASPKPLVLLPGDNDWTDCHRAGADPIERLSQWRRVFQPTTETLGRQRFSMNRQPGRPENLRFVHQGVVFVAINLPGSNNNLGRNPEMDREHAARMADNEAWLRLAFAEARRLDAPGLALLVHANPFVTPRLGGPNGFDRFLALLAREARAWAKPLLLVHGDTHRQRSDRPLRDPHDGKAVDNVLRVESYGSPFVGWVKISVDAADPELWRVEPGAPLSPGPPLAR